MIVDRSGFPVMESDALPSSLMSFLQLQRNRRLGAMPHLQAAQEMLSGRDDSSTVRELLTNA